MIRRRRPSRRTPALEGINITPFTDVLLVLLIIFMVTGSALTPQALRLVAPPEAEASPSPRSPGEVIVRLGLGEAPRYRFEGREQTWDLVSGLPRSTPVRLRAHPRVSVQQVVDEAERWASLGFTELTWDPPQE